MNALDQAIWDTRVKEAVESRKEGAVSNKNLAIIAADNEIKRLTDENAALTSNRAMLNAEATRLTNTIIERNKKIDLRGDNITKLLAERDAMRNKLDEWDEWSIRFKEWGNAYPLDIFPEVEDWAAVREALQKDGLTIGRVSASCMRHVITTLINMLPIPQDKGSDV